MWELLHTEVSYIRKLRVITNVSVGPGCRGQLSVPLAKQGDYLTVVKSREVKWLQSASQGVDS